MQYNYSSVNEIDQDTLEYLEFIAPFNVSETPVTSINLFLSKVDECFDDLDESIDDDAQDTIDMFVSDRL